MEKLKKNIEIEMPLNVSDIARLFCSMDNNEQAMFFNRVAENVGEWDKPFCFQLQSICDTELLSDGAKEIMKEIGNYSDGLSWVQDKKIGV